MLAGILIAIVVVAGLAFALPWATQSSGEGVLEGDPENRFSNSVRILRRDVDDYRDEDGLLVSTPLTRRAQLHELRMLARQAARRRSGVVALCVGLGVALAVLAVLGLAPWWSLAVPGALLTAFLAVARFSVVAMHRDLDSRAATAMAGFGDEEDTEAIDLAVVERTEGIELSVDLSIPTATGILWDPLPVTPATYVSQPLLPRTVRTIDLSAPVVQDQPVVPTADVPSTALPTVDERDDSGTDFRSRAVGE